jgi:hypothetical protein
VQKFLLIPLTTILPSSLPGAAATAIGLAMCFPSYFSVFNIFHTFSILFFVVVLGFEPARQALYHLSHSTSPLLFLLFKTLFRHAECVMVLHRLLLSCFLLCSATSLSFPPDPGSSTFPPVTVCCFCFMCYPSV